MGGLSAGGVEDLDWGTLLCVFLVELLQSSASYGVIDGWVCRVLYGT